MSAGRDATRRRKVRQLPNTATHYEIAAYGTAAALAGELKLADDEKVLRESLEEEKEADASLTILAESEINPDAVSA
jgi:ferritin-like metal-binding protein YciE